MFIAVRRLPWFKVLAAVQLALLARRHFGALKPAERRRMAALARRGHKLSRAERDELLDLAAKLEPRAFAGAAADKLSPVPLPKRLTGRESSATSSRSR
jgi:tellurite resistance protein